MLIIPKVINVTIDPEIKRPAKIKLIAKYLGMLKIKAQRDAVHAPVKGRGMATRMTRAKFL